MLGTREPRGARVCVYRTAILCAYWPSTTTCDGVAKRTTFTRPAVDVPIAMSKHVTTISEEGFTATNEVRDFETTIDSTGEDAPDTLESLLAAYASCFVPALRVGGQQRGVDDLGRIEIDVTGDLNEDDKLAAVSFDVRTESDVDEETAQQILDRAQELCKVHDALKTELHAEMSLDGGAA